MIAFYIPIHLVKNAQFISTIYFSKLIKLNKKCIQVYLNFIIELKLIK